MIYDRDQTLAMLQEIVDRIGPDTLYSDIKKRDMSDLDSMSDVCRNVHKRSDGTVVPGCIVGRLAVDHLHVDPNDIWEECRAMNAVALANWLREEFGHEFTDDAIPVLMDVQAHQDRGFSWGESLIRARKFTGAYSL